MNILRPLLLIVLALSACGPIVLPVGTPVPLPSEVSSPTLSQPPLQADLTVSSVYLHMQGESGNCIASYGPYEIRAVIQNIGQVPAYNISVTEVTSGTALQIGELGVGQSMELMFPIALAGMYTVLVDVQNTIAETNESNNSYSYNAPTPTPPVLCTPTEIAALPTETPTPIASQPPSTELSAEMLRNAVYRSPGWGEFQLADGVYYRTPPTAQESPETYTTRIREPILYGDINLDGVQDALIVLDTQNGGTGHSIELAAVLNENGNANNVSTMFLGDRVVVESAIVQDGTILLNMRVQGPNDGACCPSQLETWEFILKDNQLARLP